MLRSERQQSRGLASRVSSDVISNSLAEYARRVSDEVPSTQT